MSHDHRVSQTHQSSYATTTSWRLKDDAPMITVLVAIDTVYKKDDCNTFWEEGQQRSICKSQSGRIRTIRWTSQSDHPRRLWTCTHGSHSRCMRTSDSRNITNFTCEQQGLKWSSWESSASRWRNGSYFASWFAAPNEFCCGQWSADHILDGETRDMVGESLPSWYRRWKDDVRTTVWKALRVTCATFRWKGHVERSDAPSCEVEEQLGLWSVVREITDKQCSSHWYEIGPSLWLARFDVFQRQNAREASLVVAMRSTPVAGRPADVAAGDAPTVTRHAGAKRGDCGSACSGASLQGGSSEGVSASSHPFTNLPMPMVAKAKNISGSRESSQYLRGEKAASLGDDVPMKMAHAVEPTAKSHVPVEEHEESLAPKRQRGRPATLVWSSLGSPGYTVGCPGCDGRSYRHLARSQQKRRELGLSASSSSRDDMGDTVMSDAPTIEEASSPPPPAEKTTWAASLCRHGCDGARCITSVWSRGACGDKPDRVRINRKRRLLLWGGHAGRNSPWWSGWRCESRTRSDT